MLLDLSGKNLTTLSGITFPSNVTDLILDNNSLTSLSGIPSEVKYLSLSNNSDIISLSGIPSEIHTIIANDCSIASNTTIPSSIKFLDLSGNNITDLNFLSSTSPTELVLSNNSITSLQYCPDVLKLHVDNNGLSSLEYLPTSVTYLNVSYNSLDDLSDLTGSHKIKYLDISGNNITSLTNLPSTCKILYNRGTGQLSGIPSTVRSIFNSNNSLYDNTINKSFNDRTLYPGYLTFPISSGGYSVNSAGTMKKISNIIITNNMKLFSKVILDVAVSFGSIEIKLVQIYKGGQKILLNKTFDDSQSVYEILLVNYVKVKSTIELQGRKNGGFSKGIINYCALA